jgi:hypothetical protein
LVLMGDPSTNSIILSHLCSLLRFYQTLRVLY